MTPEREAEIRARVWGLNTSDEHGAVDRLDLLAALDATRAEREAALRVSGCPPCGGSGKEREDLRARLARAEAVCRAAETWSEGFVEGVSRDEKALVAAVTAWKAGAP